MAAEGRGTLMLKLFLHLQVAVDSYQLPMLYFKEICIKCEPKSNIHVILYTEWTNLM